jgi:hypothetical protein
MTCRELRSSSNVECQLLKNLNDRNQSESDLVVMG